LEWFARKETGRSKTWNQKLFFFSKRKFASDDIFLKGKVRKGRKTFPKRGRASGGKYLKKNWTGGRKGELEEENAAKRRGAYLKSSEGRKSLGEKQKKGEGEIERRERHSCYGKVIFRRKRTVFSVGPAGVGKRKRLGEGGRMVGRKKPPLYLRKVRGFVIPEGGKDLRDKGKGDAELLEKKKCLISNKRATSLSTTTVEGRKNASTGEKMVSKMPEVRGKSLCFRI